MLSATPINNKLTDIRNQFKLMVGGNDTGFKEIEGIEIKSLQQKFAMLRNILINGSLG